MSTLIHPVNHEAAAALEQEDDSFYIADLGRVSRQHELWTKHLPAVRAFYAVKCNSDPHLLRHLAQLGTGFDCASIEEMQLALDQGVHPDDIIFANPCKASPAMKFAHAAGIQLTTFDNHSELVKTKELMPNARLLLRIFADDKTSLLTFGEKFGAPGSSVASLLRKALVLGLKVVGTSFHIGCGASDPAALRAAVESSREAWAIAESLGIPMEFLDIGGGFQDPPASFIPMVNAAKEAIMDAKFPAYLKVIAEPGRFFARNAYTLVSKVISLRESGECDDPPPADHRRRQGMLYQNDGVFKSFMNRLVEKEDYAPTLVPVLKSTENRMDKLHAYSIWGPTCDSTDCVSQRAEFPCRVEVGDWLVYRNMGAYTMSAATKFNGFSDKSEILYIDSVARGDGDVVNIQPEPEPLEPLEDVERRSRLCAVVVKTGSEGGLRSCT